MADIPNSKYYALIADPTARNTDPASFEDPQEPFVPGGGDTGVETFLELTDTPASYSGQSLKKVKVKSDETGLEFITDLVGINLTEQTTIATSGRLDNVATPTDVIRITTSTDVTGFEPTESKFLRVIVENGSSLLFRLNSSFSSAGNKIFGLATNTSIKTGNYFDLMYDDEQDGWIPVGYPIIKANGAAGNINANSFRGNNSTQAQAIFEVINSGNTVVFNIRGDGLIVTSGMPTSDPLIAGALWNDSNTVKISAG